MIGVFNLPAITWTLTAVLLLSGGYHFLQAVRSLELTDRVNKVLHALMNVVMAAMLWKLVPSTMLAQIALLAAAALWFVIQAVARPEFKVFCAGSQGRLTCLYHSLTMAGAALMIAMMGGHETVAGQHGGSQEGMPAAGAPSAASHHAVHAPAAGTAASADFAPDLALLLTGFFGAAAVVFVALLVLRLRDTKPTLRHKTASRHSLRAEHGLEAIGAAVMALMFATMA